MHCIFAFLRSIFNALTRRRQRGPSVAARGGAGRGKLVHACWLPSCLTVLQSVTIKLAAAILVYFPSSLSLSLFLDLFSVASCKLPVAAVALAGLGPGVCIDHTDQAQSEYTPAYSHCPSPPPTITPSLSFSLICQRLCNRCGENSCSVFPNWSLGHPYALINHLN